jgi:hypothetical protein
MVDPSTDVDAAALVLDSEMALRQESFSAGSVEVKITSKASGIDE